RSSASAIAPCGGSWICWRCAGCCSASFAIAPGKWSARSPPASAATDRAPRALLDHRPRQGGFTMTIARVTRRTFLRTAVAGAAVAGAPRSLRAQPKTFKIGAVHPIPGPLAEPGQACRLGAQMAADAINAAGGIKSKGGLRLEL